ncbi:restriction endonuclease [Sphingomonas sp. IBVSS1]|nr:restriction endonuclease [Sphingomonas sp. IBVSS1]
MIPLSDRRTTLHPLFRVELEQAAFNHGYRKGNGSADGWLFFRSDEDVPGEVALASGTQADGGPWFLAVEHAGVGGKLTEELPTAVTGPAPGHFRAVFAFATQPELRAVLSRAFHLARSLPTFPLVQWEAEVAHLGDTDVERIVKERVGQSYFRRALMDYWDGRCPLTGIAEEAILRASHIIPWAKCTTDQDRLDVFNGLLLAAHWDAAFDRGLVSFGDDGEVLFKPGLATEVVDLLCGTAIQPLVLDPQHRRRLAWHRNHFGFA